jgi:hypothetical protein
MHSPGGYYHIPMTCHPKSVFTACCQEGGRQWPVSAYGLMIFMSLSIISSTMTLSADPIICPRLPAFTSGKWDEMSAAFKECPKLVFDQPWHTASEAGWQGGTVRIGWQDDRFLYLVTLTDAHLVATATRRNQFLWQLGDVLEVFAGVVGQQGYIEYHTDPLGKTLQLRWTDDLAFKNVTEVAKVADFIVADDAALVRVRRVNQGWQVYGEIPAASLPGGRAPLAGQTWQVNFGRYDYRDLESQPLLSSTSPLTKLSFHRRDEWRTIRFE